MSLVAGTVVFTRGDQSFFLVTEQAPRARFYTVKMHKHKNETALGSLLTGFKSDLGLSIENLRLSELAVWHDASLQVGPISLFTFTPVNIEAIDFERLHAVGLAFMNARDVRELLKSVDMTAVAGFDEGKH
ncbi:hypothetical protein [Weissella halotolerans]|uniref:Uncharacterized protein n=1 Tax=Weissella halotolerans DSM 20190 TaxID=1123500 RepID=A0A0R2G5P6_9LACO|nr:hypothetical protein [Weissella halotolerans]KRN32556.1 hypothetical protein IV68_GL000911 [Weissella halotolerans DSM 20190]